MPVVSTVSPLAPEVAVLDDNDIVARADTVAVLVKHDLLGTYEIGERHRLDRFNDVLSGCALCHRVANARKGIIGKAGRAQRG